jgi:putative Holliday junction resolvase
MSTKLISNQLTDFYLKLKLKHRLLGLDIGMSKIGLALSDTTLTIATPYQTLARTTLKEVSKKLQIIVNQHNIGGFVVGWPLQMNGEEGENCVNTLNFINKTLVPFNLPIYLQDERMSTMAVTRVLQETNFTTRKKNLLDDKMAASYILQLSLDQLKNLKH